MSTGARRGPSLARRTGKTLAFGLLLVAGGAAAQDGARRPMTVDDWLGMVTVSNPMITPDGQRVVYARRTVDWAENDVETSWWIVAASGGPSRRFLGEAGGRDVTMSPDGRFVSLIRDVDGTHQVYLVPMGGGEARRLTRHPTAVEAHEWSGDGRYVVFTAEETPDEEAAWDPDEGEDAILVNEGPNTRTLGRRTNLWRVPVPVGSEPEPARAERLTGLALHLFEFEPSPEGDRVAFVGRVSGDHNDIDRNEVYVADAESGAVRRLTDDRAVQDGLRWAPDGTRLSWKADHAERWTAARDRIWVLDLATGRVDGVSEALTEGRINDYAWSGDGRRLRLSVLQRTNTNLFELDLATGAVSRRTDVAGTLTVGSVARDERRIAFVFEDHDTPPDLYVADLDALPPVPGSLPEEATRLTRANPDLENEVALAGMEVIRWVSEDGTEIEGLLHLPAGLEPGAPPPLVLHLHGGPPGFFNDVFSPVHHIYAGLGYASLSPNVRGSGGYTDALREGNTFYRGDGIGYGDYQDLMAGVAHVVEAGVADPDRLGIRGWSYGAILGGYTLTRTDRFRAAVLGAGVYDWSAEYGMGYNWDVTRWYIGGTPWTDREAWLEQSTVTHVDDIVTPLLLLHGMSDDTTTEPQSAILYQAVADLGHAPVRWIRFPREPHVFREPRHLRIRYVEEFRWMERYVRGVEWTPWPPPGR